MTHPSGDEKGFSDDKLRIFKNVMLSQTAPIYVLHSELEALLHRPKAAEEIVEVAKEFRLFQSWDHPKCVCGGCFLTGLYEAWFRSKSTMPDTTHGAKGAGRGKK